MNNLKKFYTIIVMTDHHKINKIFLYEYLKKIIDCMGRYLVEQKIYRA